MENNDRIERGYWYVRHKGRISGPFSSGLIRRQVLLGRIGDNDEFSHDQKSWKRLVQLRELVPSVMNADLEDPIAKERLDAARRWADDREYEQRPILSDDESQEQRYHDDTQGQNLQLSTGIIEKLALKKREKRKNSFFSWLLIILFAVVVGFYFSRTEPVIDKPINCSAQPKPSVNWDNCFMPDIFLEGINLQGARMMNANLVGANLNNANIAGGELSYALLAMVNAESVNLVSATLVGANLRGANLARADLSDADLSYADLLSANISGANFAGAKLDNARWIDGRICAPGSITDCK